MCVFKSLRIFYIDFTYRVNEVSTLNILGMKYRNIKFIFAFKSFVLSVYGIVLGLLQAYILLNIQLHFNIINIPSSIYYMDRLMINYRFDSIITSLTCFAISVFVISYILIPNERKIKIKRQNS